MSAGDGDFEARYSNDLEVGYNAFEFLLDFGQRYSVSGHAQLHARIVTSPAYAKNFLETLQGSVERYEQSFGMIPTDDMELPDEGS